MVKDRPKIFNGDLRGYDCVRDLDHRLRRSLVRSFGSDCKYRFFRICCDSPFLGESFNDGKVMVNLLESCFCVVLVEVH